MLRTIPFLLIYPALMFFLGWLFLDVFKLRKTIPESFVCGFIISLALFQLVAFPFHVASGSFRALLIVYTTLLTVLTALSVRRFIKKRDALRVKDSLLTFGKGIAENRGVFILFAICVAATLAFALLVRLNLTDDGYYLSKSLETIESDRLNLEHGIYGVGYAFNDFKLSSDFTTYEYYRSVFSVLFGVHVTILSTAAMRLVFCAFELFAVYSLAGRLFPHSLKRLYTFMACFVALTLFGNLGNETGMYFAVRYIWHGKGLLVAVIAPVIMSLCFDIIVSDKSGGKTPVGLWVYCSLCLLASVCLSTVGIMLMPVLYVACGLPYILHKWQRIKKLSLPAVISLIPAAGFGVWMYLCRLADNPSLRSYSGENVGGAAVRIFALTSGDLSLCAETFSRQMLMTGAILPVLSLAGLIYIFIKKKCGIAKYLLGGSSVFILLTFLNPLFAEEVSTYLTTPTVYFRLYWILPTIYLIAYGLCDLLGVFSGKITAMFSWLNQRRWLCAAAAVAALVLCSAVSVFAISKFGPDGTIDDLLIHTVFSESSDNPYRLPQVVIDCSDYMLENADDDDEPRFVCPIELESYVRQYTSELVMITANRHILQDQSTFPGTDVSVYGFVRSLYSGKFDDGAYIDEILQGFDVDYVLLPEDFVLPEGSTLKPEHTFSGYGEFCDFVLYSY